MQEMYKNTMDKFCSGALGKIRRPIGEICKRTFTENVLDVSDFAMAKLNNFIEQHQDIKIISINESESVASGKYYITLFYEKPVKEDKPSENDTTAEVNDDIHYPNDLRMRDILLHKTKTWDVCIFVRSGFCIGTTVIDSEDIFTGSLSREILDARVVKYYYAKDNPWIKTENNTMIIEVK